MKNAGLLLYKIQIIKNQIEVLRKVYPYYLEAFQISKNPTLSINHNIVGDGDDLLHVIFSLNKSIIIDISSLFQKRDQQYPTASFDEYFANENQYEVIKNSNLIKKIVTERNKVMAHTEENFPNYAIPTQELFNPEIIVILEKLTLLLK